MYSIYVLPQASRALGSLQEDKRNKIILPQSVQFGDQNLMMNKGKRNGSIDQNESLHISSSFGISK